MSLVGWHPAVVLGCTTAGMCWHPRGGVFLCLGDCAHLRVVGWDEHAAVQSLG